MTFDKALEKLEDLGIFILVAAWCIVLVFAACAILLGICAAWGPCYS